MKIERKNLEYLTASAVISLLLHGLFLLLSNSITLSVSATPVRPPEKAWRPLQVQTVDIRDRVFKRPEPVPTEAELRRQISDTIKEGANPTRDFFEKLNFVSKPDPNVRLSGVGANILAPKPTTIPAPKIPDIPPPAILEIDAGKLSPARLRSERELTAKISRQELLGDRVPGLAGGSGGGNGGGSGETIDLSMRLGQIAPAPLRPDELAALENRKGPEALIPLSGTPLEEAFGPFRPAVTGMLEELVTISLAVYDLPAGGGFYRIDIAPNPKSRRLQPIPKDILFLMDCSGSISQASLNQFKAGITASLPLLAAKDRFNIVAFRDSPDGLFKELQPGTPENLNRARRFIERQERGGLTDVYNSLAPQIQQQSPDTVYRPLNVFLLSDGKSTVHNKPDNETFIRQVVKLRQDHASIFSFSAGSNTNMFLMDLLAYCNRGASIHIDDIPKLGPTVSDFFRAHSDLIVADLRYQATGDLAPEIFPKHLPHLYRGETLSLYGRFRTGTEIIGLRLIGRDADLKEQELIYRGDLRTAPRSGYQLATDWASQNVFHLLSERVLNPNPQITADIRRLAEKFKLYVPYL